VRCRTRAAWLFVKPRTVRLLQRDADFAEAGERVASSFRVNSRELSGRSDWLLRLSLTPSLRGASPSEERLSLERPSLQQYVVDYAEP
jgi:hypothetical protein